MHSQQDLQVFTQVTVHWRKGSFQNFLNSVKHSVQVDTDAQRPEMSQRWGLEASLVAPSVKNPLAMQETRVRSLGWENFLEEEMETHSSILAWKIPYRGAWQTIVHVVKRHDLGTKPPPQCYMTS